MISKWRFPPPLALCFLRCVVYPCDEKLASILYITHISFIRNIPLQGRETSILVKEKEEEKEKELPSKS